MKTIWIIDDDTSIRWVLEKAMESLNLNIKTFCDAQEAMELLATQQPNVILCDIRMPNMDGLSFLKHSQQALENIPVIIMTAHSDLDSAVSSFQTGAFEYLPKPFDIDEVTQLVEKALIHNQNAANKNVHAQPKQVEKLIGEAPAMQEVFRSIGRLAQSNITVLINGESGTGKELIAEALHQHSPRANEPFIALNMAAIPKDLIESELFGHEKGAFTGAGGNRQGRFQQANGGTLFLDEIGDMPPDTQTRLLRVLANGEFYSVGATKPTNVDVRIIAATHQNLEDLVKQGRFREDLFHRLNVIRLQLPRLSERREDIPALLQHFLSLAASELNVEKKELSEEAEAFLCQLDWPGNVRQLENCCRWISVMANSHLVELDDLPPELLKESKTKAENNYSESWQKALKKWAAQQLHNSTDPILDKATPEFERIMIEVALEKTRGRKREASELLGWGRNTLTRKIAELNIETTRQQESN